MSAKTRTGMSQNVNLIRICVNHESALILVAASSYSIFHGRTLFCLGRNDVLLYALVAAFYGWHC